MPENTLGLNCPMCGATQPAEARQCSECGERISKSKTTLEDRKLQALRRFRREIHVLAGVWILFGFVATAAGAIGAILVLGAVDTPRDESLNPDSGILSLLLFASGVCWLTSGIASAWKKRWGVYLGLFFSYLGLAGNLLRFNLCPLLIMVTIIVQAHRVLKHGEQLIRAGIPLTDKPD